MEQPTTTTTKQNLQMVFLFLVLAILAQLFFFALSVPAQTLRDRVVPTAVGRQSPVLGKTEDLTYEVKYRLLTVDQYTVFDWLEARTDANGMVTLRGQVTNVATKLKAERAISSVDGVNNINNQIEVLPLSENDMTLRKMLYRAIYNQNTSLSRYTMGAAQPIRIIVKNSNVTLLGAVESKNDSDMAFVAANAVPQVSHVVNRLQVSGNFVATVVKTRQVVR